MKLLMCPLAVQSIPSPEGLPRAIVAIPHGSQILHLGTLIENGPVGMFVLAPEREIDPATKKEKAYAAAELSKIEFVIGVPGAVLKGDYILRAPVRTADGLVFLFEKKDARSTGLLLPRGVRPS